MGNSLLWIVIGVFSIVGGFIALANPVIATLTATQIAGYIFLFVGAIQLVGAFSAEGTGAKIWNAVLGVLTIWLGITVLGHPLASVLALTTMVAIVFLVTGIVKLILAFNLRGDGPFWLILLSGAVSVLLAIMVFANFPQSAATLLGILLGVDLISNGLALIAMGLALRKVARSSR